MDEHEQLKCLTDPGIERHRKGSLRITVSDPAGAPLMDGAELSVRLQRHAFQFGVCLPNALIDGGFAADDCIQFEAFATELFNACVCENAMKWYATDKEGAAFNFEAGDKLLDWAARHAMRMRGHCLFWDRQKFVQPWVNSLCAEALKQHMLQRLQRLLGHYGDRVTCWDANNEMLDGGFFADKLGDDICAWIFREAARLSPQTPLFVNEFAILGNEEKTARYCELIKRLREQGAPVGGIGIQEHACERLLVGGGGKTALDETIERVELLPVSYAQAMQALDTMATFGLPIHLTEISAKHADPERAADGLEALYRIGFSHPGVELILLWGFWEKAHWLGRQAALVGADWQILAAGHRLKRLLLEEWQTSVRAPLVDGAAGFRGFYGSYEVGVQLPNGQTSTHEVRFDRDRTTAEIHLK